MELIDCDTVQLGSGLLTEGERPRRRGVTFLSQEAWEETCREIGATLPWTIRRANVLVEGLPLGSLIGRTIAIGVTTILVHGETKPCALMEQSHPGLLNALVPDLRGGVFGEVLRGGVITVGDRITVMDAGPA